MRRLLVLSFLVAGVFGGNILVFNPTMGYSHVKFIGNIADVLARQGHNVTVWVPIFDRGVNPIGTTEPAVRTIIQEIGEKVDFSSEQVTYNRPWNRYWYEEPLENRAISTNDFLYLLRCTYRLFNAILKDKAFLEELKTMNFDLAVTELFTYTPLGIFEVLGIKSTMIASSLGTFPSLHELTGLQRTSSYVPEFSTTYSEHMSFFERLDSFLVGLLSRLFLHADLFLQNRLVQYYYPGSPDLSELLHKRVGVVLTNVNEFTESPKQMTNMIKYIGGAGIYPAEPLPERLEALLSLRDQSVLFSLGTVVDGCSMSIEQVKDILQSFLYFPETTFLWKFPNCHNNSIDWDSYPNVVRLDWIPQADLLADERVKVFISHGGMNSMNEAVFRGKPVISIALFADQFTNSQNAVKRGYGVFIHYSELNGSSLSSALRKMLAPNNFFSKKAAQVKTILNGKEEEFRREIVRQAELLLNFGPMEHYRLTSSKLNLFQLYNIDCILFLSFLAFFTSKVISFIRCWK